MTEVAKLELDGKTYEFPVIEGSEGEKAIDIRKLRGTTGYITLDNGYMNTGSCQSGITFLNGEEGILRYRGYPIEQLAEKSNFMEVTYLLNFGELPTAQQLSDFNEEVGHYASLPGGICNMLSHMPPAAHPMGVVSSVTSSLCAFYPEYLKMPLPPEMRRKAVCQLMAQVKIIAANFYRRTVEEKTHRSNPKLGFAADFLNMMFASESYKVDPEVASALDTLLILHADHEQNCSTSAVRLIGSSEANIFATVAGGIDALWGQLHGGANQKVLEMLEQIQNAGGTAKQFIEKAKDKNDSFRLMGFGHRVYKNFDPRATIIKKACDTILKKLDVHDPLLDIALELEEAARSDSYFVERNLYPNVDFYSGLIYKALGIPTNFFTVMFVLGRLPGWLGQWKEMREDDTLKISRPRQIYTGPNTRDYVAVNKR
ncbi:MAG: citrate synthase [Halobacteriovoraceae bacterium]|jgi:citrate synthase|nr:citrate synthase [Halobacteriovoraceae bacterium]MBT5094317.1 citrate synthase [Halobacteriovoraceae bacterium]